MQEAHYVWNDEFTADELEKDLNAMRCIVQRAHLDNECQNVRSVDITMNGEIVVHTTRN